MPGFLLRIAFIVVLAPAVLVAYAGAAEEIVKVRLFEMDRPETVTLQAVGGSLQFFSEFSATPLAELPAGETVRVSAQGKEVFAAFSTGGIHALSLQVHAGDNASIAVAAVGEQVFAPVRRYDGSLHLRPDPERKDEILLVNEVGLEPYVAAVLQREYDLDELEGAKALAVAIRTYTLRARGRFGDAYDHVDHVGSQVYRGSTGMSSLVRQAVRETEGRVLTHGDELIEAVYFASSGGHTADNEKVWDSPARPYLRAKPDPYDVNPDRMWQVRIPRDELLAALSKQFALEVDGFLIEDRSKDGRVNTMALVLPGEQRRYIFATAFREAVNSAFGAGSLKSTNFTAVRSGDAYLFEGIGAGHGVGLAQWGAYGMAQRGQNYRSILQYYYTNVRLRHLDDVREPSSAITQLPTLDADVPFKSTAAKPDQPQSSSSGARTASSRPDRQPPPPQRGGRIGW